MHPVFCASIKKDLHRMYAPIFSKNPHRFMYVYMHRFIWFSAADIFQWLAAAAALLPFHRSQHRTNACINLCVFSSEESIHKSIFFYPGRKSTGKSLSQISAEKSAFFEKRSGQDFFQENYPPMNRTGRKTKWTAPYKNEVDTVIFYRTTPL